MIRYSSAKQMSIEEFQTPFEINLDKENRWVKLSNMLPWDMMSGLYYESMNIDQGRPCLDGRLIVGAMIIKHKSKLSDEETLECIRENVYLQYFVGFKNFKKEAAFDASLFVEMRKRLGNEKFDKMNEKIIALSEIRREKQKEKNKTSSDKKNNTDNAIDGEQEEELPSNKGKLQLDATVSDQMIKYPTDLDLLNTGREESERMIDILSSILHLKKKPRTYRKIARQRYLLLSKKKKKSKKQIHKSIGQQLRYLKRNQKTINNLLDKYTIIPFTKRDYKIYMVIQHLYVQQKQMYDNREHSCENRIVSIYQPHVRPIVRGKAKASVEFGSKISVSLDEGYARVNHIGWEAYNESTILKQQVEDYKKSHGYYPEAVITDQLYGSRENRAYLKLHGIRYSGKQLGRPQQEPSKKEKQLLKKEQAERNHIEGKFGQGKNGYNLNKIRTRLQKTSESTIGCIFLVMNLTKMAKEFLWLIFESLQRHCKDYINQKQIIQLYFLPKYGHDNFIHAIIQPQNFYAKIKR